MRMHAIRDRGQPALPRYSYPGRYMEKHLFQILFFNTRTQSDCACRSNAQASLDRRVLLVSQTVVESIQLFFI